MPSELSIGATNSVNANSLRVEIGIARPTATAPVASDLPPSQAVEASGESQAANAETQRRPLTPSQDGNESTFLVQKFSVDEATHILVEAKVDQITGAVVSQFPDKLALRQKAYIQQLLDQQAATRKDGQGGIIA